LLNPLNTGTHFCNSATVKKWAKELHASSEPEAEINDDGVPLAPTDQSDSLTPVLDLLPLAIASLPTLRQGHPFFESFTPLRILYFLLHFTINH
jgi:hypothetical protein